MAASGPPERHTAAVGPSACVPTAGGDKLCVWLDRDGIKKGALCCIDRLWRVALFRIQSGLLRRPVC